MKTQIHPALILLLLLAAFPEAHARLGDTPDQAEARYGLPRKEPSRPTPLLDGAREVCYHYQEWFIRCAYVQAVDGQEYIVRQEYRKAAKPQAPKAVLRIQDFELEAILDGESNGAKWKNPANPLGAAALKAPLKPSAKPAESIAGKVFQRPDGARAVVSPESDSIQFDLPHALKYEAALKAQHQQEARQRLPEF